LRIDEKEYPKRDKGKKNQLNHLEESLIPEIPERERMKNIIPKIKIPFSIIFEIPFWERD